MEAHLKTPQLPGCHHVSKRNTMGGEEMWKEESFLKHHKLSRDAPFPNRSAQAIQDDNISSQSHSKTKSAPALPAALQPALALGPPSRTDRLLHPSLHRDTQG